MAPLFWGSTDDGKGGRGADIPPPGCVMRLRVHALIMKWPTHPFMFLKLLFSPTFLFPRHTPGTRELTLTLCGSPAWCWASCPLPVVVLAARFAAARCEVGG